MFRPRALRALLRELRPVWIVLGLLTAVAIVVLAAPTPQTVRVSGLLLQVLGLTVVTTEVIRTWRHARMPEARDWYRRIASTIRPAVTPPAGIAPERTAARTVSPAPFTKMPPGASVEQRIRVLEKNIEELRGELARGLRARDKALTDVRQILERDVQARRGALSDAERSVADAQAAAFPFELVGLAWIWAGVICTTLPEPLATLAAWLTT